MGKKKTKKVALSAQQPQSETVTTMSFGYEEMLSELGDRRGSGDTAPGRRERRLMQISAPGAGPMDLLTQLLS